MDEQIDPQQKEFIILSIKKFFPNVEILAYGSRIKGSAQTYSDLDIALKGKKILDFHKLGELREFFANSSIPFKVETIDYLNISTDFQQIIDKTSVRW